MTAFEWAERHFVAGALCLEFTNTVIHPAEAARRRDRLASQRDLQRWADAVGLDTAIETGGDPTVARAHKVRTDIDRVFRAVAAGGDIDAAALRHLIEQYHHAIAGLSFARTGQGLDLPPGRPAPLLALLTHSAVALAFSPRINRVKACPNCGWLFVDSSKSGRRRWCDMRVCGNRAKARRRYHRLRAEAARPCD